MILNYFKITTVCFFVTATCAFSQTSMAVNAGFESTFMSEKIDPAILGGGLDIEKSNSYNPFIEVAINRKISNKINLGVLSSYRSYRVQAGFVGNIQPLDELGFRALRFGPEVTLYLDKKNMWSFLFGTNVNFYFDHYHRLKRAQERNQAKLPYYENTEFGASAGIGYSIKKLTILASYYRGLAYRDKELYQGYIANVQSVSLGISYRFYQK